MYIIYYYILLTSCANYTSLNFVITIQVITKLTYLNYQLTGVPDTIKSPKGIGKIFMSNIFDSVKHYFGKWNLSNSRNFTKEEQSMIKSAKVVASQYGNSVCFNMVNGDVTFIPLSSNSSLQVGDTVEVSKAVLQTLSRDGSNDVYRIDI